MATKRVVTLQPLPPHTAAKHVLLRAYLGAWFPIISKYNARVVFYDAFAGPGEYEGGEDGSPIIALKTLIDHDAFDKLTSTEFLLLFNESDTPCAEHLEERVEAVRATRQPWPANVKIGITNATFIELTTEMLDDLDNKNAKLAPTFAFVDPVGVKATPMQVLRRLTDYPRGEMLVYFATEATTRWSGAGNIDQALTDLFGTENYKDAATLQPGQRDQFLHDLYKQQLHDLCNFPYIQSFAMWDQRGKRIYDLFYCTRELLGLDRMKQAMWKVAPTGSFNFRDRFAGQDVLFGNEVDTSSLQHHLLEHFAGRSETIDSVVAHVIASTPFASNHVKTATLAPLQRDGRISSPNQRKANTFPAGTIVTFPPTQ